MNKAEGENMKKQEAPGRNKRLLFYFMQAEQNL
jgi:hypothetical protein